MNNPFSPTSGAASAPELIPHGTLAFAIITVQSVKQSNNTGGTYYNVALTLIDGPYEGRKIFEKIADINDTRNNETWRGMAVKAITRIFEVAGIFKPSDPKTYDAFIGRPTSDIMNFIDGKRCAVRIKIEKSKDPAYADKNNVGDWLSSNPSSGGFKDYQKLIGGQQAVDNARSNAFAPQANIQPAAQTFGQVPGWMKTPGSSNAPF
jgi:hypothetical protein